MAQREYPTIQINDYLALDQNSQDVRYEYLEGELRMLAGGSADHSTITTNITGLFLQLLGDGPCKVYNVDIQLQLSESRYVYPDLTITCNPRDQEPEEVQHAMGFPEDYQILGTKRQRIWQLGNAVCPSVMAEILRRCKTALAPVEENKVA